MSDTRGSERDHCRQELLAPWLSTTVNVTACVPNPNGPGGLSVRAAIVPSGFERSIVHSRGCDRRLQFRVRIVRHVAAIATGGRLAGAVPHILLAVARKQAEVHDLAITKLTAPKLINLKAAGPALTKRVKVTIQNRSAHDEVIPSFEVLASLVTIQASNVLGGCSAPVVTLISGPPNHAPRTL